MSGTAATTPQVTAPTAGTDSVTALTGLRALLAGRALPLGVLGCLTLAALTLLAPSAPTYDPWSWIVWGREILHVNLSTTDGPSWKPLPVAFTTVFALFGSAAPTLWVLVARTGAIYGALAAWRLAHRLGGGVPGGAAAAIGLLLAPWYVRNAALGNSEGLQVAFALAAIDRHLAGRAEAVRDGALDPAAGMRSYRTAFLLALALGMLRPEAWAFVGLYGLWLIWTRSRAAPALSRLRAGWPVVVGLASLPVLWLAPEWWGSGDLLRASHRAQQPVGSSPAFSSNPVVEVLREGIAMLTPPVWVGLALLVAFAVWRRELRIALLAAGVAAWVVLVAVMTAHGFSGNTRYLIVPAALLIVMAGAGAGRAVALLRLPAAPRVAVAALAALAVVVAGAFAIPPAHRLGDVLRDTSYQARLSDGLAPVVRQAGGAAKLRACGRPYAGEYMVPVVAWELHVHSSDVGIAPVQTPAVVFRASTTKGAAAGPPLGPAGPGRTVASGAHWRIVEACT